MKALHRFRVSVEDAEVIHRFFKRRLKSVDLSDITFEVDLIDDEPGCYLFLMRWESDAYKVYIGGANLKNQPNKRGLRERFRDRARSFQVGSPHDYIPHFFYELMVVEFPSPRPGRFPVVLLQVSKERDDVAFRRGFVVENRRPQCHSRPAPRI